ncbi:hypothetical protein BLX87_13105, partial [Bacillus sp. VT-16-64]
LYFLKKMKRRIGMGKEFEEYAAVLRTSLTMSASPTRCTIRSNGPSPALVQPAKRQQHTVSRSPSARCGNSASLSILAAFDYFFSTGRPCGQSCFCLSKTAIGTEMNLTGMDFTGHFCQNGQKRSIMIG